MTERPPAHLIAEDLKQIRQDKILTVDANGSKRTQDWRDRYQRHIATLDFAIEGYENLARVQAERQEAGHRASATNAKGGA
jgi:hypothetical protein